MKGNLYPGSMGLVGLCVTVLSADQVQPNEWTQPVTLVDVTRGDVEAIIELASDQGVDLTWKEDGVS